MEFIDLKTQYRRIHEPINERIQGVLEHGRFILGPEVSELEERLAGYVGVEHCIAVSSGTDALLIALMALGVGPGDEVVTTPFSFIATGEMISLLGAKPVFVDIDRRTYNIDPTVLAAAVTERTKAILPVSLYGQCADFDRINEIAGRFDVPVVEDAAQSFGAVYKERLSCGLTDIAAASFFPSKPLGCYGDGGALFTNDEEIAEIAREIHVHGEESRYHHTRVGLNGRMDTLQAAVLLAKLDIFDDERTARGLVARRYSALIGETFGNADTLSAVSAPYVEPYNRSVFAQYTIEVPARDVTQASMAERGIPTAVHYPIPLHLQPIFSDLDLDRGSFPVAEEVSERVISLPMHPYLSDSDQDRVIAALKDSVPN